MTATAQQLDFTALQPVIDAAVADARQHAEALHNLSAFRVESPQHEQQAAGMLQDVKNRKASIKSLRDAIVKPLKAFHDAAKKALDEHFDSASQIDDHLRAEVLNFRARQKAEAERIQREIEARAQQERAAREAEAVAAQAEADERALKAQELQSSGSRLLAIAMAKSAERAAAEANAATEQALQVSAVPIVAAQQKIEGVGIRKTIDFEVLDESLVPDIFCTRVINRAALRKHGIDTEGRVPVPGVRYFEKESLSV